ncbi:MAG TPA: hypothetical protein PLX18_06050 [Anaerohalosphaeraceae bacterium]|jgi:hypothetical protein|nr:hypothetical protein [Phycisphaerae bacterium]HOT72713.1 hypothetical protein [Anaerohalosphaeraceae bacterium]HQG04871.1 hypothetical protein [Anaerohalosphaeraceae bacterium]HQI07406.1 hypothetical protein [Anaerohalosphaeraceae bacterium]HQJ67694.1 hypothetical protein [Anaerohalosphaeraceae bacterium]
MFSRARLRFVVFFLTAALIVTIHLRISASRLFYQARQAQILQNQLRQQLWKKQIELEGLLQPQKVFRTLSIEETSP